MHAKRRANTLKPLRQLSVFFQERVKAGLPDHCIFEAKSSTMLFVFVCTCLLFSLFT